MQARYLCCKKTGTIPKVPRCFARLWGKLAVDGTRLFLQFYAVNWAEPDPNHGRVRRGCPARGCRQKEYSWPNTMIYWRKDLGWRISFSLIGRQPSPFSSVQ